MSGLFSMQMSMKWAGFTFIRTKKCYELHLFVRKCVFNDINMKENNNFDEIYDQWKGA